MQLAYTATQIRAAEKIALAGAADGVLMSRAARAVADAAYRGLRPPRPGRSAVLLVGGGNNGGDALYAGALLRRRSVAVTAVLADPDRAHAGGLAALRRAGGRVIAAGSARCEHLIGRAEVIIDGLVGIGARPPLKAPLDRLVTLANSSPALRVAVDIPSGIDPDSGRADGAAFHADLTVTIGGIKTGLLLSEHAGQVRLAAIGMDPADYGIGPDIAAITAADLAALLPEPGPRDNKYSQGVTAVVAGSAHYPGAALLAVGGAVRMRPGLVRYIGPQAAAVVARWPEAVLRGDIAEAGQVQAWVVGPGMGVDGAALRKLREVLAAPAPALVDADGLTLLAGAPALLAARRGRVTVLTPHAGEFTRLFPDLDQADRLAATRAAAARSGAIVLLKGHRTVVAAPDGRAHITLSGSPYLATAGSGDVLSGMAGALLATGMDPLTAVALAAHVHGVAGQLAADARDAGAGALLDLIGQVPAAVRPM